MAYPHKWSPISYKSSAGQRKDTGQRPMLYRWTTQPGLCDDIARETTGCRPVFLFEGDGSVSLGTWPTRQDHGTESLVRRFDYYFIIYCRRPWKRQRHVPAGWGGSM